MHEADPLAEPRKGKNGVRWKGRDMETEARAEVSQKNMLGFRDGIKGFMHLQLF
jgi:hypothetical protein